MNTRAESYSSVNSGSCPGDARRSRTPTASSTPRPLAGADVPPGELLARWRTRPGRRSPRRCRGYPTGRGCRGSARRCAPTSMATARFMETWAHALDVAEALGVELPSRPTGSGTSPTSASAPATSPSPTHGLEPPAEEFRVELIAPSGELWSLGPDDAAQTVTGSAYDFCLLVTQRRAPRRHSTWSRRRGRRPRGWTSPRPSPARPATGREPSR